MVNKIKVRDTVELGDSPVGITKVIDGFNLKLLKITPFNTDNNNPDSAIEQFELDTKIQVMEHYKNNFPNIFGDFDLRGINLDNIEIIIDNFLKILYNNVFVSAEYQPILDDKTNVVFKESLLRIKCLNSDLNHLDYLDLHNSLDRTLNVFSQISEKTFSDIQDGKEDCSISINSDIDDILDNELIFMLIDSSKTYGIDLYSRGIIIELLENKELPKTEEFRDKLYCLKSLGIKFAMDDIDLLNTDLSPTIDKLNFLGNNIDIIKIDGKQVNDVFLRYKNNVAGVQRDIDILKNNIDTIVNKGIMVVAEWIENLEVYYFVKNILGVKYFQGFYSKNPDYLAEIKKKLHN